MTINTDNIIWNIPEQKQGTIAVIGGNSQSFRSAEQNSAYLAENFPFKQVLTVLPDSLKSKLPPLENLIFCPSTNSGSFAKYSELQSASGNADISILVGDFSKNAETAIAITELIKNIATPVVVTRDAVDLITTEAQTWIEKTDVHILASTAQLQKLFRALYYPKMILLTAPLLQITEALHKFTLTYPCSITTFHDGQLIVAYQGETFTIPITKTSYTPLTLWQGTLACNIAALNFYNPNKIFDATVTALTYKKDR